MLGLCRDVAETVGPVVRSARADGAAAVLDPQLAAIPVMLDLEQPVVSAWWLDRERGQLRTDELGHPRSLDRFRPRGDFRHGAPGLHADIVVGQDRVAGLRELVLLLDQEPGILLLAPPLHPHQHPGTAQLVAGQAELEAAFGIVGFGVAQRLPGARVPDHDGTAAIFSLRDRTLEGAVVQGMVLDMDCQTLVLGIEARAAGDRPALVGGTQLQPQVVMQPAGGMLLYDEAAARLHAGSTLGL